MLDSNEKENGAKQDVKFAGGKPLAHEDFVLRVRRRMNGNRWIMMIVPIDYRESGSYTHTENFDYLLCHEINSSIQ